MSVTVMPPPDEPDAENHNKKPSLVPLEYSPAIADIANSAQLNRKGRRLLKKLAKRRTQWIDGRARLIDSILEACRAERELTEWIDEAAERPMNNVRRRREVAHAVK